MDDARFAAIAKSLGHPARIRILRLLAEQTECRGAELFSEIPLAQSTISEHLRVLKDAGLVSATPVGTAMTYCLDPAVLDGFGEALSALHDSAAIACGDSRDC
jgi:ArsR family transcriptional regulator